MKPWTIFNETLIHDFDTLCWLNPGARVTEVYAQAAALIHPQFADAGYLDTSVVQLRFDNGAFGTAEASFQAVYGYDVRGEVFGSDGVLLAGTRTRAGGPTQHRTVRRRLRRAVRPLRRERARRHHPVGHRTRRPRGARNRLGRSRIRSHRRAGRTGRGGAVMTFDLAVCAEMVFTDLDIPERARRIYDLGFAVEIWSWHDKDLDALAATGARSRR